jgi:hypothetical protein
MKSRCTELEHGRLARPTGETASPDYEVLGGRVLWEGPPNPEVMSLTKLRPSSCANSCCVFGITESPKPVSSSPKSPLLSLAASTSPDSVCGNNQLKSNWRREKMRRYSSSPNWDDVEED